MSDTIIHIIYGVSILVLAFLEIRASCLYMQGKKIDKVTADYDALLQYINSSNTAVEKIVSAMYSNKDTSSSTTE